MTDPDGNNGTKYLIAFYNYKYSRTPFSPTSGETYGYSAIDFLNHTTGNSRRVSIHEINHMKSSVSL